MDISTLTSGIGLQGIDAYGIQQVTKKTEDVLKTSGDTLSISDEAKYLYAAMQENGAKSEEQATLEGDVTQKQSADAIAEQSESVSASEGAADNGGQGAAGNGGQGGGGGGGGGDSSESTVESEIATLEGLIAAAKAQLSDGESSSEVAALESQLASLQAQL